LGHMPTRYKFEQGISGMKRKLFAIIEIKSNSASCSRSVGRRSQVYVNSNFEFATVSTSLKLSATLVFMFSFSANSLSSPSLAELVSWYRAMQTT